MNTTNKTLIFFLDAVREDYITKENTPFLYQLKKEQNFMNLIPLLGYSSWIHPTIWTWQYQEDHGNFLIYGYDPENSPFKWMKFLAIFPEKIKQYIVWGLKAPYYLLPKLKRFFPQWFIRKILPVPASIDPKMAWYFKIMNDPFENTFFKIMKEQNITLSSVPSTFNKNYWKWVPVHNWELSDAVVDFFFNGDTDWLWHYPGPNSDPLIKLMNQLDKKIESLFNEAKKLDPNTNMFIFSDHGMEEIVWTVDVKTTLESLNLKPIEDYIVFYDSTFIRFWINNKKAEKVIINALSKIDKITYLDESLKEKYKINFKNKKWWDLFFIADNGYRVFPDNFSPMKFNTKGMHGYFPENNKHAQWIFMTNTFKTEKKEIDVVDLFPTMLEGMGLKNLIPKNISWKSIYKK